MFKKRGVNTFFNVSMLIELKKKESRIQKGSRDSFLGIKRLKIKVKKVLPELKFRWRYQPLYKINLLIGRSR